MKLFRWLPVFALFLSPAVSARIQEPSAPAPAPFVLDPGHGGKDLGSVSHRLYEKDIALAIAQKVKKNLELLNSSVLMTRNSDSYRELDERVADGSSARAFISFHLNEEPRHQKSGITVFAFGKSPWKDHRSLHRHLKALLAPPKEVGRESSALATSLVNTLRAQGFSVDAPERAGFYVLKNPNTPSILIEMGYLSNPKERARLAEPSYQDKLAKAIAAGLSSYDRR
jgi:N-acetylmuramoyl-L-alanine amidase